LTGWHPHFSSGAISPDGRIYQKKHSAFIPNLVLLKYCEVKNVVGIISGEIFRMDKWPENPYSIHDFSIPQHVTRTSPGTIQIGTKSR
jgi:hypothetical protein